MKQAVARAARALDAAGVPSARHDAQRLAAHVAGTGRAGLLTASEPDAGQAAALHALVERRAAREPLQHLLGSTAFRRVEVAVGPGVFVPRPETEVVAGVAVAAAQAVAATGRTPVVVDLCTGSGAIALAVADEVPTAQVDAVEVDPAAHAWAQRNLRDVPRVVLHVADVADAPRVLGHLRGRVDVVVANPPYLPDAVAPELAPEVRDHDPARALYGGPDGLAVVRTVVSVAADLLRPDGLLVCEHDDRNAPAVRALLGAGWQSVATGEDLAGRPRYVRARRGGTG